MLRSKPNPRPIVQVSIAMFHQLRINIAPKHLGTCVAVVILSAVVTAQNVAFDTTARRAAARAIRRLAEGHPEDVRSRLRAGTDNTVRSLVIHDVPTSGVPSDVVIQLLRHESDQSVKRALI